MTKDAVARKRHPTSAETALRERIRRYLEDDANHRRWVLIAALTGMFATSFPVTILAVSLGDIADEFETTDSVLTWAISGPFLASAVALPALGKLGDLRGQRIVFLAGFTSATLVAALTALAWDPLSLITLRVISQVVGAATQPTSMALIMRAFPPEERVRAQGWWSLVAAGAPAVGLVLGGPLVELAGWRAVFAVQAGLSIIPLVVAAIVLRETSTAARDGGFDIAGAAALAVAAGSLLFGLSQGTDWGWAHPLVVMAFAASPVFTVAFVKAEQRAAAPLLSMAIIRDRDVAATLATQALSGAAYMGSFVVTPLLLRGVFGWSVSAVAGLMVIRPLSYSLSSPVGGRLAMRFGERPTAIAGTTALAISMGVFALGAGIESVPVLALGLLCQGVGNGIARPPLGSILSNAVDERDLGIAAAAQRMARLVGNAIGIAAMTAAVGGRELAPAFAAAYVLALLVGLLAVGATRRIRRSRPVLS